MKAISKKDSERILNYLTKARKIVDSYEELGDDISMRDKNIAYDCIDCIGGIMVAVNNTVM